jgi:hypothetical protein
VEGASVVPDRDVADPWRIVHRPLEPDSQVVVLTDDFLLLIRAKTTLNRGTYEEILEQQIRLILRNSHDALGELFVHEKPLPASDRVGSDHRVDSLQGVALVQGVTPLPCPDLVAVRLRRIFEPLGLVVSREAFEELGDRGRETRVSLVCGGPDCVTSGGRVGVDLQNRIVGRHWLKGDISVPPSGSEPRPVVEEEQGFSLA